MKTLTGQGWARKVLQKQSCATSAEDFISRTSPMGDCAVAPPTGTWNDHWMCVSSCGRCGIQSTLPAQVLQTYLQGYYEWKPL